MINKRDLINLLFILSFPVYGVGTFISASISPTAGYLISMSTHMLIVLFYIVDLLYKKEFSIRVNWTYSVMLLYIFSCIASLFIALFKGLPEATFILTIGRSLLLLLPFHAFIAVVLYNDGREDAIPRLLLLSLSLLLGLNLVGYFGFGLSNAFHTIEGRLSMPFFDGFYSGANVLAMINLILLYYILRSWANPVRFASLATYFVINLVLFYSINSRLSTLILVFVIGLVVFKLVTSRVLFFASMFTIPVLLNSALLLYQILTLPALSFLVQRVDIDDVTTFNGRSYLWQDALDWLLYDQRGLLLGNGYKGHYFLDLIPDVVKLWNAVDTHHLHLHSTSMEVLLSQGVLFFALFCILFYRVCQHYRKMYQDGREGGALFTAVMYLLFVMQVDTFLYLDSLGFIIFSVLVSRVAVSPLHEVNNETHAGPYQHLIPATKP